MGDIFMGNEKLGFIVTLISASSFGAMGIFAKIAYNYNLNTTTILTFRFVIAAIILWTYLWFKKEYTPIKRGKLYQLIIVGTIGYGLVSVLYFSCVKLASASLAGILLYLHPILVYLTLLFLKQDAFAWKKVLALIISFTGLIFVLGSSFKTTNLLGILAGLGSAFAYTFYIVAGTKVMKEIKPLQGTVIVITSTAATYLLLGLIKSQLILPKAAGAYLWMFLIAIISTVLAISLFWIGVSLIGPTNASIISTIEPLVTVILAFIFLKEKLTISQTLGGILIISGVVILKTIGNKTC
jgi:drug/metabolite transporter (DMT)-like permease